MDTGSLLVFSWDDFKKAIKKPVKGTTIKYDEYKKNVEVEE